MPRQRRAVIAAVAGSTKSYSENHRPLLTDLQQLNDVELVELHLHSNEWYVRHARRILHERSAMKTDLTVARQRLRNIFDNEKDELLKLRVLWTRYVVDDLNESELTRLLSHQSIHVRRWAVRFLTDRLRHESSSLPRGVFDHFVRMAHHDSSPKVRLELACALQTRQHQSPDGHCPGIGLSCRGCHGPLPSTDDLGMASNPPSRLMPPPH